MLAVVSLSGRVRHQLRTYDYSAYSVGNVYCGGLLHHGCSGVVVLVSMKRAKSIGRSSVKMVSVSKFMANFLMVHCGFVLAFTSLVIMTVIGIDDTQQGV